MSGKPDCRGTPNERFDSKYMPEPNSGCWIWTGGRSKTGYGKFWYGGRVGEAHRFSYERSIGPIPAGLELDHRCRTPSCVNPEHLRPITHRLNTLIGETRPALHIAKTHCIRGHEFNAENTYVRPDSNRQCIPCKKMMARVWERAHRRRPLDIPTALRRA